MKKFLLLFVLTSLVVFAQAQTAKGRVIVERINSPSLQNSFGEDPVRRVTIYLPPNYDQTTNRYPVIYYLHGFAWSDSGLIASDHFDVLMDKAISTGKIRPVILVMPNEYTLYKGSFYTNSALTGRWADFTSHDLVTYIDQHYRTIPDRESRGIAGHSMGGHGALKVAMLFPDVFSSVYALSPGVLALTNIAEPSNQDFKKVQQIKTREEMVAGWKNIGPTLMVALGRTYSPDPNNPPFYADFPYFYKGDTVMVNRKVLELWNKNCPLNMIDDYVDNLRKLKAIKFDWGRNDEFAHIPITCKMFSMKLESYGIKHYAEEYIGTHGSMICTDDGRLLNELMPFFNEHLTFEEVRLKTKK